MLTKARAFNVARLATAILPVALLARVGYLGQPLPVQLFLEVAVALIGIVPVTQSAAPTPMRGDRSPPSFFLRGRSAARDVGLALLLRGGSLATAIGVRVGVGLDGPSQHSRVLDSVVVVPATCLGIAVLPLLLRASAFPSRGARPFNRARSRSRRPSPASSRCHGGRARTARARAGCRRQESSRA